ncbi:hypothetical protein DNTS_007018 [Danionella cerebrum]|uniref:CRC domain-containing protein n=1 Tax=Danionella cerebrum TaxID=2873325 RepID=A0A553QDH7_9TELE|nr:hypothetical protein DNTS_007018 [Danionella translucida]
MNELEGQEYSYRGATSEGHMIPHRNAHGSPQLTNLVTHHMPSAPGYSRIDETQREDDYATYRILHPVACDPMPQVTHYSPATYSEYILAQPSHYHCPYNPWASQGAFHHGMPSAEMCRGIPSIGPDAYCLEGYSMHQGFRHGNHSNAFLLSSHGEENMGEKSPAQTSNIQQPVQVVCDVDAGGQLVMLNQWSPGHIPRSMMTGVHSEFQSSSAEDRSIHVDVNSLSTSEMGNSEMTMSSHNTSSLSPGSQTLVVEQEDVVQPKGCERLKWEKSKRPCNCTKSQCLKLYCECFAYGEFCNNCKCVNCFNNTEHDLERSQAVKACLVRNPGAFRPKIGSRKQGTVKGCHTKGCNCKRSGCLKNYCECYEVTSFTDDNQMCPLASITPDVVEATCGCLLVQAEEAEKEGLTAPHAERMILEEFGQCLTQIVGSIFKSTNIGV